MAVKFEDFADVFKVASGVPAQVTQAKQEIQEQVESVKQTAITYGGLTLLFQGIAAISAAIIAYSVIKKGNRGG